MMDNFLHSLQERHAAAAAAAYPCTEKVHSFCNRLINWMFPEHTGRVLPKDEIIAYMQQLQTDLTHLLEPIAQQLLQSPGVTAAEFMEMVPGIYDDLTKDAEAILAGDPAATCQYEIIRTYPGFYAVASYRIAHALHLLRIPLMPRIITEIAHTRTGVDIHPAATIAPYFCIDHGTGIVIGETTIIGMHVKLYQGVTLGALSVDKSMAQSKRHPTIEDHVVIYSGATILGGDTVIGHHSIIGGNVWMIKSVPPYSRIYYRPDGSMNIIENRNI